MRQGKRISNKELLNGKKKKQWNKKIKYKGRKKNKEKQKIREIREKRTKMC